jgi:flagellar FliL protein
VATHAADGEEETGKKGGKKKLIIIGALVLALAGGGAGAWFLMGSKHPEKHAEEDDDEEEEAPAKKGDEHKGGGKDASKEGKKEVPSVVRKDRNKGKKVIEYLSGDPTYTINLADEDADRYLQLGLVFEITDIQTSVELKERMPAVRSDVLLLLSAKRSRELNTLEGKETLSEEILALTRRSLAARQRKGVKAVDFSMFVIQ